jgi:hypothetical protein
MAAIVKDRFDLLGKQLIGLSPWSPGLVLMGVKSAGRNFQRLGQSLDLEISLKFVHELEALMR